MDIAAFKVKKKERHKERKEQKRSNKRRKGESGQAVLMSRVEPMMG